MPHDMLFVRITVDPNVMGGVPTVRGLRFPVATVVAMVADGMAVEVAALIVTNLVWVLSQPKRPIPLT